MQAQTPLIDGWRALAEEGVAEAQFQLGSRCSIGAGIPQDDAEAFDSQRRRVASVKSRRICRMSSYDAGELPSDLPIAPVIRLGSIGTISSPSF